MNNKINPETDKALLQSVVDSLDGSIEHLDGRTLSRLNQARHQALAAHGKSRLAKTSWQAAGTFAALSVFVMTGWLVFSVPDRTQMSPDAFELVVANEDYELMQDLDFVAWMIAQDNAS